MKPTGWSFIIHRGRTDSGERVKFRYLGKYVGGVFPDNNHRLKAEPNKGWGIKFDLFLAQILRPIARGTHKGRAIWQVSQHVWDRYFGERIAAKLRQKNPDKLPPDCVHDFKYDVNNPWKGRFAFRLNSFIRVPCVFLSVATPWRSFYIGVKTYDVDLMPDPYVESMDAGDITWIPDGTKPGRYAAPSATIRRNRK